MDLVTANALDSLSCYPSTTGSVSILLNKGDGTFFDHQRFAVGNPSDPCRQHYPEQLAIGDLNRDGITDIVTANRESDTISVLIQIPPDIQGPGFED